MKKASWIDFLKVRASYGLVGSDNVSSRFPYLAFYGGGSGYDFGNNFGTNVGGTSEGNLANANLTWEKARKLNVGIDFTTLNQRLALTIDAFYEYRFDIITDMNSDGIMGYPDIVGKDAALQNLGEVSNRGVDIELSWNDKIGKDFRYYIRPNLTFSRNRLEYKAEVARKNSWRKETGKRLYENFVYVFDHFVADQEEADRLNKIGYQPWGQLIPGDVVYKDLDRNGVIDDEDRTAMGNPRSPELMFGIPFGFQYKNFDFSVLLQGATKSSILLNGAAVFDFPQFEQDKIGRVKKMHLDRWTPETAATAKYPALHYGTHDNNKNGNSSLFLYDASYLRLKNVEIGYNVSPKLLRKFHVQQARIYVVLPLVFTSCSDYLDRDDEDNITEADVFARYEKVNGLVSDVYAAAKKADRPLVFFEHFSNSAITDECEGTNVEGNITNNFNNGAWNPNSLPGSVGQYWEALYEGIRKANLIIENVQKYNTPDNPQQDGDLRNRIGEMYFMRGYFHMLLLRMYGEAPYIDRVINAGDNMDFKKESVHSMVEKIVTDAQTAYGMVPNKYVKTSENFGRVDKGACLGLISFVRWVAATPLWNGASQYGYNLRREFENEYAYDATRWRKAKEAAKAVLDFEVGGTKRYSLYTKHDANDFKDPADGNLNDSRVYARLWDMFYDMDAFANEYVFFMTKSKDQAWQGDIYPPSREGSSRQQPVQEQVDEYEYIVGDYGYPVYSAEARKGGYDDTNPYVKGTRDPRFYRDVIYHGAPYRNNKNESKTINTASGSDKIGATNATTTGYYLRKFQQESWNKSGNFSINAPAIWRLPEFIYIYAEACNELGEDIDEAYKLVNTVRERSFMKPMPPEVKTNQQLMREYIQRERRVELFYEGKRPWTCRLYLEPTSKEELAKESLWKSSGSDNSKRTQKYWAANNGALPRCQRMINGMRPVQDENGAITVDGVKYRMERFCVEERTFSIQHYLFPIRQSELQKTPTIEQNPGW